MRSWKIKYLGTYLDATLGARCKNAFPSNSRRIRFDFCNKARLIRQLPCRIIASFLAAPFFYVFLPR